MYDIEAMNVYPYITDISVKSFLFPKYISALVSSGTVDSEYKDMGPCALCLINKGFFHN